MSIAVAPSATYEATVDWGVTGLTGTLGVRLLNNAGGTTQARVTAGIAEYPAGSGIYYVSKVAPGTRGQYTLLWDDGAITPGHVATEDLLVTSTSPTVVSTGSLYITREQIKAALGVSSTFSDADIDLAASSACRAIDNITGRRFYPTDETRYYTPDYWDGTVRVDDILSISSASVDSTGDSSYGTTWVEGTDFYLDPPNAALVDEPYGRIVLFQPAGRTFSGYQKSLRITGTFGWAAAPPGISQYAEILATRLIRRARDAPFGFATHGAADAAAFVQRNDPDFQTLVGPYMKTNEVLFV